MLSFIVKVILYLYRQKCTYVDKLKSSPVLTPNVMVYNYATGSRVDTLHFVWKVSDNATEETLGAGNSSAIHKITPLLQVFHTRAMYK